MRVTELFEAAEPKDIGTLEIVGDGDTLTVKCTAKSGPMLGGLYWVWKFASNKSVKTSMMKKTKYGAARLTELDNDSAGMDIFNRRPTKLVFSGISRDKLQIAVDKAIQRTHKDIAAVAKHKAGAPERKKEAAKFQAEKRKTDLAGYDAKYGKGTWKRVTYKQEGGDDGYSYTVRVDGQAKWDGLTQRQAMYYKEREVDAIAKREGLGKYAKVTEGLKPGQSAWKAEMTKKGAVKFKRDEHGGGAVDRIVAYNEAGKVVGGFNLKARVAEGTEDKSEKLATLKRRLRELTTDYHNMGYTFSEAERKLRVKQIRDEIAEIEAK